MACCCSFSFLSSSSLLSFSRRSCANSCVEGASSETKASPDTSFCASSISRSCLSMASFSSFMRSANSWLCFECSASFSSCSCRACRCSSCNFSCSSICFFSKESDSIKSFLLCSFFFALVLMSLHREANSKVLRDSSTFTCDGLTHAMSTVRLFPDNASFNSNVNLDSRNGGVAIACLTRLLLLPCFSSSGAAEAASAMMTRLSVVSDWLMAMPSCKRAPSASVFFCFSLPAKSTKWIFDCWSCPSKSKRSSIEKTACDREDCAFMEVAETARFLEPKSRSS
mmetsp:Transcript_77344/g.226825  ORF Transcript_77344/g.226825 Transcript_77344/m.226825 type:complete len:283 (+) Transcript_77344:2058-2906(+)